MDAWYRAGRWIAPATSPCTAPGRLGQQTSMVPPGAVSVDICGPGGTTGKVLRHLADAKDVVRLATALNGQPTSTDHGFTSCPGGAPKTWYTLVFSYRDGPGVSVQISVGCNPEVENGSLQSRSADSVLPLIR